MWAQLAGLVLLTAPALQDQDHGKARLELLRMASEHAPRTHPWAGAYFAGDGTGFNQSLYLAPGGEFATQVNGCLGVSSRRFGHAFVAGERIELVYEDPPGKHGDRSTRRVLVPVTWGERRYLVAEDRMERFCEHAKSGTEPRRGRFGSHLLRRGDEELPVKGPPEVPARYRDWLVVEPVTAVVVDVDGKRRDRAGKLVYRVTLDKGSADGLERGTRMRLDAEGRARFLTVERTRRRKATAVVEAADGDADRPERGWTFTTRLWAE